MSFLAEELIDLSPGEIIDQFNARVVTYDDRFALKIGGTEVFTTDIDYDQNYEDILNG